MRLLNLRHRQIRTATGEVRLVAAREILEVPAAEVDQLLADGAGVLVDAEGRPVDESGCRIHETSRQRLSAEELAAEAGA